VAIDNPERCIYGIYMGRKRHETTVFRSGNSNAVRLPKGFAAAGERVRLRQLPGGRTLIEPARIRRWPKGFLDSFGRVTKDFEAPPRPAADAAAEQRAAQRFGSGQ
jgi:virulence-associated protein VagC